MERHWGGKVFWCARALLLELFFLCFLVMAGLLGVSELVVGV
jgi:hypothetical protein